ncbi:unnamed protein product [Amoebophrya sp. A25]|nr:unnamed protein product [Amoebophrya sp. A25]|eukprot:GSA25T00018030001.1
MLSVFRNAMARAGRSQRGRFFASATQDHRSRGQGLGSAMPPGASLAKGMKTPLVEFGLTSNANASNLNTSNATPSTMKNVIVSDKSWEKRSAVVSSSYKKGRGSGSGNKAGTTKKKKPKAGPTTSNNKVLQVRRSSTADIDKKTLLAARKHVADLKAKLRKTLGISGTGLYRVKSKKLSTPITRAGGGRFILTAPQTSNITSVSLHLKNGGGGGGGKAKASKPTVGKKTAVAKKQLPKKAAGKKNAPTVTKKIEHTTSKMKLERSLETTAHRCLAAAETRADMKRAKQRIDTLVKRIARRSENKHMRERLHGLVKRITAKHMAEMKKVNKKTHQQHQQQHQASKPSKNRPSLKEQIQLLQQQALEFIKKNKTSSDVEVLGGSTSKSMSELTRAQTKRRGQIDSLVKNIERSAKFNSVLNRVQTKRRGQIDALVRKIGKNADVNKMLNRAQTKRRGQIDALVRKIGAKQERHLLLNRAQTKRRGQIDTLVKKIYATQHQRQPRDKELVLYVENMNKGKRRVGAAASKMKKTTASMKKMKKMLKTSTAAVATKKAKGLQARKITLPGPTSTAKTSSSATTSSSSTSSPQASTSSIPPFQDDKHQHEMMRLRILGLIHRIEKKAKQNNQKMKAAMVENKFRALEKMIKMVEAKKASKMMSNKSAAGAYKMKTASSTAATLKRVEKELVAVVQKMKMKTRFSGMKKMMKMKRAMKMKNAVAAAVHPMRERGTMLGLQGKSHRTVEGLQGKSRRTMEGLQGKSRRTVEGLQGKSHRTVEGLQGKSRRTVEGLQGKSRRTIEGLQGKSRRTVEGLKGRSRLTLQGLRGRTRYAMEGVRGKTRRTMEGTAASSTSTKTSARSTPAAHQSSLKERLAAIQNRIAMKKMEIAAAAEGKKEGQTRQGQHLSMKMKKMMASKKMMKKTSPRMMKMKKAMSSMKVKASRHVPAQGNNMRLVTVTVAPKKGSGEPIRRRVMLMDLSKKRGPEARFLQMLLKKPKISKKRNHSTVMKLKRGNGRARNIE